MIVIVMIYFNVSLSLGLRWLARLARLGAAGAACAAGKLILHLLMMTSLTRMKFSQFQLK